MPTITSWQQLKEALGRIEADGERGFEGLVAHLFECETGQRFYVARKGDQPAGDAYGPEARTALQAKRMVKSAIRENNVEGDIDRALRETPALDIYVVAATRASSQLRLRLEDKSGETGLEIILLALTDDLSEFGALCVAYWEVTRGFVPSLDAKADAWARAERQSAVTLAALERLRGELRGLQTQRAVADGAASALARRFQGEILGSHMHNRVRLSEAVERPVTSSSIGVWWTNPSKGVSVLEGDEGTGKTWLAAAAGQAIWRSRAVPVFWLDSLAWMRISTVAEAVRAAIRTVFPPGDDGRLDRICRKVFQRWATPILIILDGANERGAWEAAELLLHDYDLHRGFYLPRVRLLFTSRRLENRPIGGQEFWRSAQVFRVGPFSPEELKAALARFAPETAPNDLPKSVRDLAHVPRYFRLCVELRDRFASAAHVTKELLLWTDLEQKLANRDPQWTSIQKNLGGAPHEILSFLARQAKWPADSRGASLPRSELLLHLPRFEAARHDLAEQRIVVSADLREAVISAEHLVLGWALVLRETAKAHAGEGDEALSDRLHRLLEPAASNDDKARALHVAALLTFLDPEGLATGRAALLRLWVFHHNAAVTPDALVFFARTDLRSYASVVEAFFCKHIRGRSECMLIAPLAVLWRDCRGDVAELRAVLERWLRLVFPGDESGSKEGDEPPPPHFPVAVTGEQLRLSYAAAGVISFRPDPELLPALADCYRSQTFTYYDKGTGEPGFRVPLKSPMDSLGALARWHYGEGAIPILAEMAAQLPQDGREWRSLHWFARLWRQTCLPEVLGTGEDIYRHESQRGLPPRDELRNWLLGTTANFDNLVGSGQLERLAVRRDLPDLSSAEVEALIAKVGAMVADTARYRRYNGTWEERSLDNLLPWLARCNPSNFARQIRDLWKHAVASGETLERLLHLDEMPPGADAGGDLVEVIRSRRLDFSQTEDSAFSVVPLTVAMLLFGSATDLHVWLKVLETQVLERNAGPIVGLIPLPTAFEGFAPTGFEAIARDEVDRAVEALQHSPGDEAARTRTAHWLQVFAYVAAPNVGSAQWALGLADTLVADDAIRFALFRIASRSPDPALLRRTIIHPAFQEYHVGRAASHWQFGESDEAVSSFTFEELSRVASLTVTGQILFHRRRDDDLRLWGRAMVAAALAEWKSAELYDQPRTFIETRVAPNGELKGFGTEDLPSGEKNQYSIFSGVWGIDRQSSRPSPTQADYERLCQELRDTLDARRATSWREIAEFNAVNALWRWSELEPDAFTAFATEFIPIVKTSAWTLRMDFGFFADAVFIGLLRLDPAVALRIHSPKGGVCQGSVTTISRSLEWTAAVLWEPGLNASNEVRAERRQRLIAAPHDEALLWQSLAARLAGNATEVAELATEFLASASARDRALGVTLLAYQGDEQSLSTLKSLCENDASFWVRDHAYWAWEACATEAACRARYREVVAAESLELVAAGLAEMRMALSPLAHGWRGAIERDAAALTQDRRKRAYLDIFWEHWGNSSSRQKNIKLCGRELLKHCRGEQLKDGVTGRMAPWWKLD